MNKEQPEQFDRVAWEEAARQERAESERREKEKDTAYEQMYQYAIDLGCKNIFSNPAMHFVEFKTWQEALDFQAVCKDEFGFEVRVQDPPAKDNGVFKQGFRVYPIWKD